MSWIIKALIWSRMLVFAFLTTGITGSVFYLVMRLFTRMFKIKNPYILLFWQKIALCLYTFPVVACAVFFKRAGVFAGDGSITGVFWTCGQPFDDIVCRAGVLVWLGGFLTAIAKTFKRQKLLDKIWQKNELADRSGWLAVFEEYKRRFALPNVRLYQNPLVFSPVVAKRKHFMIVLPAGSTGICLFRDFCRKSWSASRKSYVIFVPAQEIRLFRRGSTGSFW